MAEKSKKKKRQKKCRKGGGEFSVGDKIRGFPSSPSPPELAICKKISSLVASK